MLPLLGRYRRRLAWFVAGLLCAVLLAAMPNQQQSVTAATPSDRVNTKAVQLQQSQSAPNVNYGFAEMAASHLEPNFYH